jgi:hypothetical protein
VKISTRLRVVATVFAALAISVAGAANASAASLPVLHGGQSGTGQEAHTCIVLGSDGTTQGVACIDLLTGLSASNSGPGDYVKEQVELLCQTISSGADVQCANAVAQHSISNGEGQEYTATNACGHANGPCATGRNYWSVGGWNYPWSTTSIAGSGCTASTNQTNQVWAVVYGNYATSIELPKSGKTVYLVSGNDGENESTGHYFVCV